jgi:hypothetical protein
MSRSWGDRSSILGHGVGDWPSGYANMALIFKLAGADLLDTCQSLGISIYLVLVRDVCARCLCKRLEEHKSDDRLKCFLESDRRPGQSTDHTRAVADQADAATRSPAAHKDDAKHEPRDHVNQREKHPARLPATDHSVARPRRSTPRPYFRAAQALRAVLSRAGGPATGRHRTHSDCHLDLGAS